MNYYFCTTIDRGVAQPGLEYSSGGRGVGSSNLLTPTKTGSLARKCEAFLLDSDPNLFEGGGQ